MVNYLIDTSVIIDYLRGNEKAVNFLNSLKKATISFVTVAEVYQGVRDKNELRVVKDFLKQFEVIQTDKNISEVALGFLEKYSLSNGLLILDALIASTAVTNNLVLVTGNIKHFKMIGGLKLKKWDAVHSFDE